MNPLIPLALLALSHASMAPTQLHAQNSHLEDTGASSMETSTVTLEVTGMT